MSNRELKITVTTVTTVSASADEPVELAAGRDIFLADQFYWNTGTEGVSVHGHWVGGGTGSLTYDLDELPNWVADLLKARG